jgi:adenosylcobinamide-GDP ribazoletransferase
MKTLLLALQFLTIVPVRVKGAVTEKQIARSAVFFPLIGALQGLLIACAAYFLTMVFPSSITAGFIILFLVSSNGGFHLDGLADSFDALSVKSTGDMDRDREKRFAVMKDSTSGAVGVVAIVMDLLLKYLFVNSVLEQYELRDACGVLFLMPAFSKWAMIPPMFHAKPASNNGLGRIFITNTGPANFALSSLILVAIFSLAMFFSKVPLADSVRLCALVMLSLYLVSFLWVFLCRRKFGGLTGDNFGAMAEIAEIVFLTVLLCFF